MNNLIKLINIAKRIHHTEASRSEILTDLASISEKELEEIEAGLLLQIQEAYTINDISYLITEIGIDVVLKRPTLKMMPLNADGKLTTNAGDNLSITYLFNIKPESK